MGDANSVPGCSPEPPCRSRCGLNNEAENPDVGSEQGIRVDQCHHMCEPTPMRAEVLRADGSPFGDSGFHFAAMRGLERRCPTGHPLQPRLAPVDNCWCDECGVTLTRGAALKGCRRCNYDLCESCSQKLSTDGTSPRATARLHEKCSAPAPYLCRLGHPLMNIIAPADGCWCDQCGLQINRGGKLHGCRLCNYDLCHSCADAALASRAILTALRMPRTMTFVAGPCLASSSSLVPRATTFVVPVGSLKAPSSSLSNLALGGS